MQITIEEQGIIINALNAYWLDAHENLKRKDLGDIEKRNYQYQLKTSKNLMDKFESNSEKLTWLKPY